MSKIAIKSNKDLMFPPMHRGVVTMEIDLIQNKPKEELYELRIIDTCTINVEETKEVKNPISGEVESTEIVNVKKVLGTPVTRLKSYTYEDLGQLSAVLNLNHEDFETQTDYINELFRQGLLITTQQECEAGKGMYFSETKDWEIVRD
ncbi:hypothetical protein [Riemerella columbina]|uniref:hypothetical protein n=1 Tax=Riemerella columbina TaxID=103810 RepID=UPI000379F150|nr:hypothetical protein [Riemerella columbina]